MPFRNMETLSFLSLLLFLPISLAQSCWRDTPCTWPSEAAFPGPWEKNHYSPSSRNVSPSSLFPLNDISNVQEYPCSHTLMGNASAVVYDFGKEVGGVATIRYTTTGDPGRLGVAFTEAKNWIGLASDSSNGPFSRGTGDQACADGAIYDLFSSDGSHTYKMDFKDQRGGFRYLTAFLLTNGTTSLAIESIDLEISFAPTWPNLQAYQGYFHSSDDELNKIWYGGAYTLQTNVIPSDSGRFWDPPIETGWANNATLSNGTSSLVDGAKRDRSIWPGDMEIAVPSAFVSIGDLESVRNGLQNLYDYQTSDGEIPRAGLPILSYGGDAYHCWAMIGTYNYVLYTDDMAFIRHNWEGYKKAMDFIYAKVLPSVGLLNSTGTGDWGRLYTTGTYSEANMVLYRALTTGAELASWMSDEALSARFSARAGTLKDNIMHHFYNEDYGSFRDNLTETSVYPQDANSMALLFGVAPDDSSAASRVSEGLTRNWTPIGAETPELPDNISPFISSFEIQGHLTTGKTMRALDLIRRSWGWYLHNENGTQSTHVEGYLTNGTFGYRSYAGYAYDTSYTSHAHGWSTGPTSALTNYILGLSVTGRAGTSWKVAPQFGDLSHAEGGFTTKLGKFWASWKLEKGGRAYKLEWSAPCGTLGEIELPPLPAGCAGKVKHNGQSRGMVGPTEMMRMEVYGGRKASVEVTI